MREENEGRMMSWRKEHRKKELGSLLLKVEQFQSRDGREPDCSELLNGKALRK